MASAIPFFAQKAHAGWDLRGLGNNSLLSVQLFFIRRDRTVGGLVLPDADLGQIFQLGIQRTLVIPGDLYDFIKQLRLKSDPGLHLTEIAGAAASPFCTTNSNL